MDYYAAWRLLDMRSHSESRWSAT